MKGCHPFEAAVVSLGRGGALAPAVAQDECGQDSFRTPLPVFSEEDHIQLHPWGVL